MRERPRSPRILRRQKPSLNAVDAVTRTMEQLLEETQRNIVDLARSWREGNTQHRQELCFSLFPAGIRYSRETKFFEPHNTWLMNSMQEMIDRMQDESLVGVADGI
jgi:hypothetical protein